MNHSVAAPTGRGSRGTYAKSKQRRTDILNAALSVFGQHGYRAGSLRQVSEKVGLTEAGLLHHFGTKADLLRAVLDYRDQQSNQLAPLFPPAGEASIRGLVRLIRYNTSVPGVIELYVTLSAEAILPGHPAHDYFVARYESLWETLTESFEQLDRDGMLAAHTTPRDAATQTISMMDGLQLQWLLRRDAVDMSQQFTDFLRRLTRLDL